MIVRARSVVQPQNDDHGRAAPLPQDDDRAEQRRRAVGVDAQCLGPFGRRPAPAASRTPTIRSVVSGSGWAADIALIFDVDGRNRNGHGLIRPARSSVT